MEENIQDILENEDENVVQFNFENNTSSPVAITLLNSASLTTIPTSGNTQTGFSSSNDLIPSLPRSIFALNPNNATFIASGLTSPVLNLINTTSNKIENDFDNSVGFNSQVRSFAIQSDGKIIVGGAFITYKGVSANRIIRLNTDGSKDASFDYGTGFDNAVLNIQIQPNGKIICVGFFTTFKGITENRIIRLNPDGSKDTSFDNSVGFDFGVNGITSLQIQPDGKILVGGSFTTYKGVSANRIIRLNPNGLIDTSFNYGTGFNNTIFSITIQPDGKILVGGAFTTYKGLTENYIIRLNTDGSKDTSFDNSVGFSFITNIISIQPDGKILVGGNFTSYKGVSANRIIRLNTNGSIDTSFNSGTGLNQQVESIAIQPDGKILVGGNFTTYKGLTENYIIRLNPDGSKDTSFDNSVGFGGSGGTRVISISIQPDGKILVGGAFTTYKGYVNNNIIKLNSSGLSLSSLVLSTTLNVIQYNSVNNVFYGSDFTQTYVISSDARTILSTIALSPAEYMTYNINNNRLYLLNSNRLRVINCSTNFLISTIILPNNSSGLSQVTPSNEIYYFDNVAGLLQKFNCTTNTISLINLALPNITSNVTSITYNNGYLYITSGTSNIIDIVNTNTNTYFSSITIPAINNFRPYNVAINPSTNQLFITDSFGSNPKQYAVIDFASNSLVSVNSLGGVGGTYGVFYNSLTNSIYISGSLYSVVQFTATPFFIGGSTNYNSFVNSLGYQPIEVQMIRFVAQNQTQLYNQVQFSRIDANGNQIFFSEFPILKVDAYQEQGNIAELKLDGLVFDGNTYINNYIINPSQVVSFEIIYKQLDRFSESPSYPIFFKHKVQLKEYIKQDYSDYEIEM